MKTPQYIKTLSKKSFLGSLIFAFSLWLYTSFNSDYKTFVNVPITVLMPSNLAIENDVEKSIALSVQGSGWDLFNLIAFNNSKKIVVDLSKKIITDSVYVISRGDILKGLQSLEKVQIEETNPEFITINTGEIIGKKLPVKPRIDILTNENYTLVGNLIIIPDSIEVFGNEKLISKLQYWETSVAAFNNVSKNFKSEIKLSDTLKDIVKLSRTTVEFYADIQQIAEIQIPDIEIIVRGGSKPRNSEFLPPQVTIVLQGGINELQKITKDKVAATIDINRLLSDSTGIFKPKIEFPSGVKLLRVEPPYVYHYVVEKLKNLSEIK